MPTTDQTIQEPGEPTPWDIAWRQGYTSALEAILGIPQREAYRRAKQYWRPGKGWRVWLARRLLRASTTERSHPR